MWKMSLWELASLGYDASICKMLCPLHPPRMYKQNQKSIIPPVSAFLATLAIPIMFPCALKRYSKYRYGERTSNLKSRYIYMFTFMYMYILFMYKHAFITEKYIIHSLSCFIVTNKCIYIVSLSFYRVLIADPYYYMLYSYHHRCTRLTFSFYFLLAQ